MLLKEDIKNLKKKKKIKLKDVKKALKIRNNLDISRKNSPLLKHRDAIEIDTGKLNKQAMLQKMSKTCRKKKKKYGKLNKNLKKPNPYIKNSKIFLDKDFKDRKLKENEIIKATVTEITKNLCSC